MNINIEYYDGGESITLLSDGRAAFMLSVLRRKIKTEIVARYLVDVAHAARRVRLHRRRSREAPGRDMK